MPSEAAVFRMDLGPADALLPTSDFYGLVLATVSVAATVPVAAPAPAADGEGGGQEVSSMMAKGRRHGLILLDPLLEALFGLESRIGPEADMEAPEPVAFLMARGGLEPLAFVSRRPFEVRRYALGELRLPPPGLRRALRKAGVIALRFETGARPQYLLSLGLLAGAAGKVAAA